MHAAILEAVLPELRETLTGLRVTKVELLGKYGLFLSFSGSRRGIWLSAHPELSRVGLVDEAPALGAPRTAPDNLSEPLGGARLEAIEQEPAGRVARMRFERDASRHREPVLIAELIPRFANVVLVGDEDRILWSAREFKGPGRPRQVAAGETYVAPSGGPAPADAPPVTLPAEGSANAAADAWYRPQEEVESSELLAAELRRMLVKRRKRAAKALQQIERRLTEADREGDIRRQAELLAARLHEARRGMSEIRLTDFDGESEVAIALDPKLDPQGNADALFKKARRLARGRDEMVAQRSIQEAEVEAADRGLGALDPLPPADELRALVQEIAPSLLRGARGAAPRSAAQEEVKRHPGLPEGFTPRVYELPGGWQVWVGRNAKQNDQLTHRYAHQRDLWFHARGAQGSHTVLRVGSGKGEPTRDTIEAAAQIAAFYSKARNSKLVPVAYTEKRYVRKPRKAPVGTALMMREKVLMVEPKLPESGSG